MKLQPSSRFRPELLNIPLLISIYGSVALIIHAAEKWPGIASSLLAIVLIAILQNYLQILQHEAAHGTLAQRRGWNESLGEALCAWPFFTSLRSYRHFHFEHHRHLLDPTRDPEVEFYREQGYEFRKLTAREWFRIACLDLSGFHAICFLVRFQRYLLRERATARKRKRPRREWIRALLGLVAAIGFMGNPEWAKIVFVYWIVPQFTVLFFILKIQGYGEHGIRTDRIETCTANLDVRWWIRVTLYPLNSHLHRSHHLAPERPWFRLKA